MKAKGLVGSISRGFVEITPQGRAGLQAGTITSGKKLGRPPKAHILDEFMEHTKKENPEFHQWLSAVPMRCGSGWLPHLKRRKGGNGNSGRSDRVFASPRQMSPQMSNVREFTICVLKTEFWVICLFLIFLRSEYSYLNFFTTESPYNMFTITT